MMVVYPAVMKCLSYHHHHHHRMKCSSRLRKLLCRCFIRGMIQLYAADGLILWHMECHQRRVNCSKVQF